MSAATVSVDEFQALEQKVLQTVELIKSERQARAAAEAALAAAHAEREHLAAEASIAQQEVAALREQLAGAARDHSEMEALQREREAVRTRVERMLSTLEELL